MVESPRLSFLLQKCLEQMRSLHRHDADRKGVGHSPTSILNLDLKNTIQKLQVGTNLPCLLGHFSSGVESGALPLPEFRIATNCCSCLRELTPSFS